MSEILTDLRLIDETGIDDTAAWRALATRADRTGFVKAWLALQCRQINGAVEGLLMLSQDDAEVFEPVATWPSEGGKLTHLVNVARAALTDRNGISRVANTPASEASGLLAYPVIVETKLLGAVAICVRGNEDPRAAMRRLQWGVAALREHLLHEMRDEDRALLGRARAALDLLGVALDRDNFVAAALGVATEIARRFDVSRVSIGFVGRGGVKVRIISHTAQFSRQMNLVARVQAAMNEAVDQRCTILFPAEPDSNMATRAHADLSRLQHGAQLLTVPIFCADRFLGAMTFERPQDRPFTSELALLLDAVATTVGPLLDEQRRNDQWLIVKIAQSLRLQVVRLLGPGHLVRKLAVIGALALAVFATFAKAEYRVDADAQIEGLVRRAVVAPYDGFLRDAPARAGDLVKKGQVLAAFDDRDLSLERLRWVTERQQRLFEYDKALATRQPAAINVTRAQIDQAEAQIRLIEEQLSRLTMTAPIDGLVVSGDLSQLVGASINRGQVLFEIAPLDGYRAVLAVDERQVGSVKPGESGELVVNALPTERFAFKVEKVTPVAEARSGRNTFRVEGLLTENSSRLRPGMEGVAKIDIGIRPLVWIWTRTLIDWLRLAIWQYLG